MYKSMAEVEKGDKQPITTVIPKIWNWFYLRPNDTIKNMCMCEKIKWMLLRWLTNETTLKDTPKPVSLRLNEAI